ncbi:PREDICTED: nucleolar GTP-binding protein 1 [Ipomoea nil]|uniref:nucleolar GTP-binding protein 1 n=1 Tax=Ipomoea nil TaxID=35883 RepID=UPI0009015A60|nr:PREDICTED: nucleolar GTP-binding protein 1 [Ipomoea nil]
MSLLQLWQIPSSSFPKLGLRTVPGRVMHPMTCLCKQVQTTAYEIVNGSYIPSHDSKLDSDKVQSKATVENTGAFRKLPMVMPSIDILYSALRKAKRVSPTKGIANIAKRERNRGAKQLDALLKELALPLRTYKETFPRKEYLHPYERSLIELTLGDGNYEAALGKIEALRKKVVSVGKEHASLCAKSMSKREAEERLSEGMKKLEEIFQSEGKAVDKLLDIAKTLRAMPVIDLETPTLCLVGAPNVGKSSLVRILSTGKPEICNYPFTTRGILMGHITLSYQNFQVTDTPGILRRHDEDRNNLEKLTLAVLTHLPTAVLYVHDLSGECGTSPSDQFAIYKEIRARFSDHIWLDVVSKCDLLRESPVIFVTEDGKADDSELARYRKMGPDGALHVSVKNEVGLDDLKSRVHHLLISQSARIKTHNSNQEDLGSPQIVGL